MRFVNSHKFTKPRGKFCAFPPNNKKTPPIRISITQ